MTDGPDGVECQEPLGMNRWYSSAFPFDSSIQRGPFKNLSVTDVLSSPSSKGLNFLSEVIVTF